MEVYNQNNKNISTHLLLSLINQSLVLPLSALPAQHHADRPDALVTGESDVGTDCEKPQMQSEEVCSADCRKVHENGAHDNREYGITACLQCLTIDQIGDPSELQHNINGEKLCDQIYHLYVIREDPHNVVTQKRKGDRKAGCRNHTIDSSLASALIAFVILLCTDMPAGQDGICLS